MRQRGSRRLSSGTVWVCLLIGGIVLPTQAAVENWVATWATGSLAVGPLTGARLKGDLEGHTIRQVVPLTVGGTAVRIRLSNRKGTGPFRLDDTHAGVAGEGAALAAGSNHPVTFNGRSSILIPPGAEVISDPLDVSLPAMQDLAISFHVALQRGAPSIGGSGAESYIASGRVSAQDDADGFSPLSGAVLLSAVDVVAGDAVRGAIVAFGDSITAGGRTSWPGVLASRLAERPGPTMAVLNYGIGGNRLLFDSACWGDSGLARLDEALSQSGVTTLILSGLGGNDVRLQDRPGDPDVAAVLPEELARCADYRELGVTAEELITGMQQVVERARARGITVYGGPIGPSKHARTWTVGKQAIQDAVNAWTRTPGAFDGIIDFAAPCVDPDDPHLMSAKCDRGDHLHPTAAGSAVMAEGIDLSLLLRD